MTIPCDKVPVFESIRTIVLSLCPCWKMSSYPDVWTLTLSLKEIKLIKCTCTLKSLNILVYITH